MRVWALGLLLVLFVQAAARADDPVKDFHRLWQDAGSDDAKKGEALDTLARARSAEAAKLLLSVALMPNESGAIMDRAITRLAELDGSDGDGWIRDQLKHASKWIDRAILARAVARRTSAETAGLLVGALQDKAWQVQAAALEGLRHHATREVIEALLDYWAKLDPKKDDSVRVGGDARDTALVLIGKDFQTAADAKSWWSANQQGWVPPKKAGDLIESKEGVTQERTPKLFDDITSRRIVLVLDTSGSMLIPTGAAKDAKNPGGLTRFEVMRREVRRVIEDFPPATTFNIISFSGKVLPWKDKLIGASEGNKRAANKFIDVLKADGETNSYGALEQAFKNAEADTVYFLSDGYPTVGKVDFNVILAEVRKWNAARNLRIHTIAFIAGNGKPLGIVEGDKALPKEFMRRLAQENGGHYKLVE